MKKRAAFAMIMGVITTGIISFQWTIDNGQWTMDNGANLHQQSNNTIDK